MRVSWTPRALAELEAIQDHIGQHNPTAAHRLVRRVFETANTLLSRNPLIGRKGQIAETRELVIAGTAYIVAYRVTSDQVEIAFVMHGARQWPEA